MFIDWNNSDNSLYRGTKFSYWLHHWKLIGKFALNFELTQSWANLLLNAFLAANLGGGGILIYSCSQTIKSTDFNVSNWLQSVVFIWTFRMLQTHDSTNGTRSFLRIFPVCTRRCVFRSKHSELSIQLWLNWIAFLPTAQYNEVTQQCNVSPYIYAVYWLRTEKSAFSLARKCNWLTGIMVMRCKMRHAWTLLSSPTVYFLRYAHDIRESVDDWWVIWLEMKGVWSNDCTTETPLQWTMDKIRCMI